MADYVNDDVLTVLGGCPSGLAAAITLARAGRRVRVLERIRNLGIDVAFPHQGFQSTTFYDSHLQAATARTNRPLFCLVRRVPAPDTGPIFVPATCKPPRCLVGRAHEVKVPAVAPGPVENDLVKASDSAEHKFLTEQRIEGAAVQREQGARVRAGEGAQSQARGVHRGGRQGHACRVASS